VELLRELWALCEVSKNAASDLVLRARETALVSVMREIESLLVAPTTRSTSCPSIKRNQGGNSLNPVWLGGRRILIHV